MDARCDLPCAKPRDLCNAQGSSSYAWQRACSPARHRAMVWPCSVCRYLRAALVAPFIGVDGMYQQMVLPWQSGGGSGGGGGGGSASTTEEKLSATDDAGIAIGAAVVVLLLVVVGAYFKSMLNGGLIPQSRAALHTPPRDAAWRALDRRSTVVLICFTSPAITVVTVIFTSLPCLSHADWCLRSDVMLDSRLDAGPSQAPRCTRMPRTTSISTATTRCNCN